MIIEEKERFIIFLGGFFVTLMFYLYSFMDFGLTNEAKEHFFALCFGLYLVFIVLLDVYQTLYAREKKKPIVLNDKSEMSKFRDKLKGQQE